MIRSSTFSPKATTQSEGFWERPLGYPHAFLTVLTAMSIGLAFHVWVGYRWIGDVPLWITAAVALGPLLAFGIVARLKPGSTAVRWLTGIPFAMVACSAVGIMAILGGVAPESFWQAKLGLPTLWASWPFIFAMYLMMVNLIGSCGRRALPLTYTNVIYLASHLGLAIAIGGGALSSIGLERRTMVLFKGMPTQAAYDQHEHESQMPFEVELREFRMETFAPSMTLAVLDDKAKDGIQQTPGSVLLKNGAKEKIAGRSIVVERFLTHAAYDGLHWREVKWKTAAPAALISVTDANGKTRKGWICSGSPETAPAYLQLDEKTAIFMNRPMPKKFESDIRIDGKDYKVGVNEPIHVKGYDIYQFSYDEKMGAASSYSVVEVVKDRFLNVVYAGIFLMLFGATLHLWNGVGGRK